MRLQNMILWCLRFDITVKFKPGIKIQVADAQSSVQRQRTSLARKKSASSPTCSFQSSYSA